MGTVDLHQELIKEEEESMAKGVELGILVWRAKL
jgi:hypothetical protein